ncbi:MAG: MOSC domain-containing protein [Beijerinckiaceae bacterium]
MTRAMRLRGAVAATLRSFGRGFETQKTEGLDCTFEGIREDAHASFVRKAGGREPWFARGTEIRNERAVSLVSVGDCVAIARAMSVAAIEPEWLGANLVLEGFSRFSFVSAGTRLFFASGAVLAITAQNAPCIKTGKAVARQLGLPADEAPAFVKAAQGLRGLVAVVERPGLIRPGDGVEARVPAQWIYPG